MFIYIKMCVIVCFLCVTGMYFGKALVMTVAIIWQTNLDGRSVIFTCFNYHTVDFGRRYC